ncbi:hypothetical protein GCM10027020_12090 [Nocardioides salsibiostraticola]
MEMTRANSEINNGSDGRRLREPGVEDEVAEAGMMTPRSIQGWTLLSTLALWGPP